jgi:calcium-dependent protein kinase
MLRRNPQERISAAEAYVHPWLRIASLGQSSEDVVAIYHQALLNLRSYKAEKKLQTAVLSFIASQVVNQKDTESLKDAFLALDANGDGQLSREELVAGF